MIGPLVPSRMKQGCQCAAERIDAGKVRAFVKVAVMARKREIVSPIRTAMLFCNDVFDVMEKFTVFLVKAAVLTTSARTFTDKLPDSGVHAM